MRLDEGELAAQSLDRRAMGGVDVSTPERTAPGQHVHEAQVWSPPAGAAREVHAFAYARRSKAWRPHLNADTQSGGDVGLENRVLRA